jgi:soluble lytic murein transglycosylase-like protein
MLAVERWRPLAHTLALEEGARAGVTVPELLVLAIVAVESAGDPRAVRVEPDGRASRGLMQILENTAREIGFTGSLVQLNEPETGLRFGIRYLARQLARYQGNVAAAVAAYNAGTAYYDEHERFRNQGYVDKVAAAVRALASGLPAPLAGIGTILVLLLAWPLLAKMFGVRR